jgi:two-component system response regulator DevR
MEQNNSPILKIVTVDDSLVVSERLQCILSDIDNVRFLGNARSISIALSLINQQKPNVVILDIHLEEDGSEGNGMSLIITLREKYPEMKIIVFTNLSELHYRITCLANGANYFFDKSNDFTKISATLKKIHSQN